MVEIFIPGLETSYDFCLDACKPVSGIIAEIIQLIMAEADCDLDGAITDLWLCAASRAMILNPDQSLAEQGIGTGVRLLLV